MRVNELVLVCAAFVWLGVRSAAIAGTEPSGSNAPTALGGVSTNPVASPGEVVNSTLPPPEMVNLSPAVGEVVRLAQAGLDTNVILVFVTNSVHTFNLSAAEVVYLNDLGIPAAVITAMIQQDQKSRGTPPPGAATPEFPAPAPMMPGSPAVQPQEPPIVAQEAAPAPAPATSEEAVVEMPPPPPEELPPESTVDYFYGGLAPYGTWIVVPGYGRCWRPTAVVTCPGWRPYCQGGQWVWTNAGWYWYSDYSWGWAPFHYGRWYCHPHWGWCWMPGNAWGPAWVSWRTSDACCGWAPLPPAACYRPGIGFSYYGKPCGYGFHFGLTGTSFTFIASRDFFASHYDRHSLQPAEVSRIYSQTTLLNANRGIEPQRVAAATGRAVQPVSLRDTRMLGHVSGQRHEVLAPDNRTLTIARPAIPSGSKPASVAVKRPVTSTPVQPQNPPPLASGAAPVASGAPAAPVAPTKSLIIRREPSRGTPGTTVSSAPGEAQSTAPIKKSATGVTAPAPVPPAPAAAPVSAATPWLQHPAPQPTRVEPQNAPGVPGSGRLEPAQSAPAPSPPPVFRNKPVPRRVYGAPAPPQPAQIMPEPPQQGENRPAAAPSPRPPSSSSASGIPGSERSR
jgi:hypothetical protein